MECRKMDFHRTGVPSGDIQFESRPSMNIPGRPLQKEDTDLVSSIKTASALLSRKDFVACGPPARPDCFDEFLW